MFEIICFTGIQLFEKRFCCLLHVAYTKPEMHDVNSLSESSQHLKMEFSMNATINKIFTYLF